MIKTTEHIHLITSQKLLQEIEHLLGEMLQNEKIKGVNLENYYRVDSSLNLRGESNDVTMPNIFARLIGSQQNRSMMPHVIKYWDYQYTLFDKVLLHHNPQSVLQTFGDSADDLYKAILKEWPKDAKPLDNDMKGLWAQWCKAVLSAAKFLVQFKSINELHDSFHKLYHNTWTKPALPALLAMEIDGLQFTLACDFLKECGYDYPKPDVHITDVFEPILKTRDTYQVFKAVIAYAEQLNMTAFQFDKMIWLVCSGNFYLDHQKCPDRKAELLKFVESAL